MHVREPAYPMEDTQVFALMVQFFNQVHKGTPGRPQPQGCGYKSLNSG